MRPAEVQRFDAEGNFLTKWGQLGHNDGQFDHRHYVAVDDSGKHVCVTDVRNGRVQKFTYTNRCALAIARAQEAGGSVSGQGIDCGTDCRQTYEHGALVTLQADPTAPWSFDYWDDGTQRYYDNPLSVTMDSDKTFMVHFR